MDKLQLTYKELEEITYEDYDRFKVLYDDIPRNGNSSLYIEDDGRQLRYFEFEDTNTGRKYDFSYVYHPEFRYDFPASFIGSGPEGITFVDVSVINPPKPVEPEVKPVVYLTPEAQADADLMAQYDALFSAGEIKPYEHGAVPSKVINSLKKWMKDTKNDRSINMYGLRAKFIPVAIEHRVTHQGLWQHVQGWSRK